MKGITPFLWFNNQAEEAARFYTSVFKNSRIDSVTRYDAAGARASGRPEGSAMTVEFHLDGAGFVGLNGGPQYNFTEAVSFVVNCESQEEIDYFWEKLSEGGEQGVCGWLKDKYKVSWQIVPDNMEELLGSTDKAKAGRAMGAMLKMKKIIIKDLQEA